MAPDRDKEPGSKALPTDIHLVKRPIQAEALATNTNPPLLPLLFLPQDSDDAAIHQSLNSIQTKAYVPQDTDGSARSEHSPLTTEALRQHTLQQQQVSPTHESRREYTKSNTHDAHHRNSSKSPPSRSGLDEISDGNKEQEKSCVSREAGDLQPKKADLVGIGAQFVSKHLERSEGVRDDDKDDKALH